MEEIEKKKLISISELFKKSFNIYKENVREVLFIGSISFVLALLSYILNFSFIITILISITLMFLSFILPMGLLFYLDKREMSLKESIIFIAKKKLIPLSIISILTGLIIFGAGLLFILPGIYFAGALFAAGYIVVLEDKKPIEALLRSWEYVKGNCFKIICRFIVLFFVIMIVSTTTLFFPDKSMSQNIFSDLIRSFIASPFSLFFAYLIYKDLKNIKGETLEIKKFDKAKLLSFIALGIITIALLIVFALSKFADFMLQYNQ